MGSFPNYGELIDPWFRYGQCDPSYMGPWLNVHGNTTIFTFMIFYIFFKIPTMPLGFFLFPPLFVLLFSSSLILSLFLSPAFLSPYVFSSSSSVAVAASLSSLLLHSLCFYFFFSSCSISSFTSSTSSSESSFHFPMFLLNPLRWSFPSATPSFPLFIIVRHPSSARLPPVHSADRRYRCLSVFGSSLFVPSSRFSGHLLSVWVVGVLDAATS